jgi:hypothetical protein
MTTTYQFPYTFADIREMRRLHKAGTAIKDIAAQFKINYQVARNIVIGETWREPLERTRKQFHIPTSEDYAIAKEIRELSDFGETIPSLMQKFNMSKTSVYNIVNNISYKEKK